ncbi:VWA domain-containing protein [Methylacidimicrobium sp. B4]|uniref:VWA domain-containing protein n=1 Tax=Methylacidimicrobium sp. B4 TaxID=2796139 RepID=UPI001F5C54DC|nr:VWA domain-containing protein [Methylacidimicrobium sp. B4]
MRSGSGIPLSIMGHLRLGHPFFLFLLALLPLLIWARSRRKSPVWMLPFSGRWKGKGEARSEKAAILCAYGGLLLAIFALAQPLKEMGIFQIPREGYDILLVLDLSGSMLAEDYERGGRTVSRFEAVQGVVKSFLDKRVGDRIGLVAFSGRAYTVSPLTFDHRWLDRQIDRLEVGMIEDGTAIGDAVGLALTRLIGKGATEAGKRKGRFLILLTDGGNNCGTLSPDEAIDLAAQKRVPIFTIGAGRLGDAGASVLDEGGQTVGTEIAPSDLDEALLRRMAQQTGGRYFRALDEGTIREAFAAIDAEKKVSFSDRPGRMTEDLYPYFLAPALLLWGLALFLARRRLLA